MLTEQRARQEGAQGKQALVGQGCSPRRPGHAAGGFRAIRFTWNSQQAGSVLVVPYRSAEDKR